MPDRRTSAPPHPDLAEVLLSEAQIKRRVRSIAREIKAAYGDGEFTLISLINGAVMFTADLMREIDNPVRLDCVRVSSYGAQTKSIGTPQLISSLTLDIRDRQVLVIDDILDTGQTISRLVDHLMARGVASVKTCVLLRKVGRQQVVFEPNYTGFSIPNEFVVGYGLDYNDDYRHLPYIGVLPDDTGKH